MSVTFRKRSKKEDQGAWDYMADQNSDTRLIKLYDKCMLIGSTHAGVTGSSKLKRFDSKTKTSIE